MTQSQGCSGGVVAAGGGETRAGWHSKAWLAMTYGAVWCETTLPGLEIRRDGNAVLGVRLLGWCEAVPRALTAAFLGDGAPSPQSLITGCEVEAAKGVVPC